VFGRAVAARLLDGTGATLALAQTSYDALGRAHCTAQRMDPAKFASPSPDACNPDGTPGPFGPDRVSQSVFDPAGQVVQSIEAKGTPDQAVTGFTYTLEGQLADVTDPKGNVTRNSYDGLGRLVKTAYPDPATPGQVSWTDYEAYTYDAGGMLTIRQLRDGTAETFAYDDLGRLGVQTMWTSATNPMVTYRLHDLLGRVQYQWTAEGQVTGWQYDALGRATHRMEGVTWPAASWWSYSYDLRGLRTGVTWPDGQSFTYEYDTAGAMTAVRETGATSGPGVLATYGYDDLGRRTLLTRGNGVTTAYAFDAVSRLTGLTADLAGTANDLTKTFAYSPASGIVTQSLGSTAYVWTGATPAGTSTVNGLNQLLTGPGGPFAYDAAGEPDGLGHEDLRL
jgi:YD repeat-containing protein